MSKIAHFSNRTEVKQEACEWLMRIDGDDLDAEDIEAFKEWVGRGDYHQECLVKLAEHWDSMSVLEQLAEIFPYTSPKTDYAARPAAAPRTENWLQSLVTRGRENLTTVIYGGGVLAACVLTVWIGVGSEVQEQQEFVTRVGEQASYRLQDGSEVKLNTNSRLMVEYSDSQRLLTLLYGEVNFDVVSDPERPFRVYAGSGMLQAVGTMFNVRYISDVVDVTVIEGKVNVVSNVGQQFAYVQDVESRQQVGSHPPVNEQGKILQLTAGQSATYDKSVKSIEEDLPAEQMSRKLAWHDGTLLFQGETLREALAEISQYTDKELVIVDESIADLRIGGHYSVADIDALLLTISQAFDLRAVKVSNNQIQFTSN